MKKNFILGIVCIYLIFCFGCNVQTSKTENSIKTIEDFDKSIQEAYVALLGSYLEGKYNDKNLVDSLLDYSKNNDLTSDKNDVVKNIVAMSENLKEYFKSKKEQNLDDFLKYSESVKGYFTNTDLNKFVIDNNIELTAEDVQYDMVNNLDKPFVISGIAKIDDYYNYGFEDYEKDYFCVFVIPDGGTYTDGWYLYLSRIDYYYLFQSLKEKEEQIIARCIIPKEVYKSSQGNMALVQKVR